MADKTDGFQFGFLLREEVGVGKLEEEREIVKKMGFTLDFFLFF